MTTEEAIKWFENRYDNSPMPGTKMAFRMAIEALKDQNANRWIPCNEGLPEESGYYDVTVYDGYENRTTYVKFSKRNQTWYLAGRRAYWMVLAWKPRTEPYKVVLE